MEQHHATIVITVTSALCAALAAAGTLPSLLVALCTSSGVATTLDDDLARLVDQHEGTQSACVERFDQRSVLFPPPVEAHDLGFETIGTVPDAFDHADRGPTHALIMYRRL